MHRFDVKTLKTTKVIKLQWLASISCQNDQNNSKLQKRSNYNELHRFDLITIKNVELRRNEFKTTQNYKINQITMTCIDFMSKHWKQPKTKKVIILRWICIYLMSNRSKMLSYVAKHSKQPRTKIVIILRWICIYLMSNRSKMLSYVAEHSKLPKTKKSDHIMMNLHLFDVKSIKNVELRSKTFKTTQKYKSDQITMNCIDLTS